MSKERKNEETIEEAIEKLQKLMMDPTRVAIWFEILRTPGITANELMDIIDIQKTAMYYHLGLLEEENVIDFDLKKKEKHFRVSLNFFSLFTEKRNKGKITEKNTDLFFLFLLNSFIQKEIVRVSNIPDTEYKAKKYPLPKSGMWFCTKEKLTQIKEEYLKLWERIKKIDQGEGPENIVHTPLVYYWGLAIFEEE
ncbi:MAG: hypothetical protein GF308_21395 [Candidatus Heimdallarchaeota archaeon]|nr:hypothetical protein [Candidatus Heimdallarchaeota archaeon]